MVDATRMPSAHVLRKRMHRNVPAKLDTPMLDARPMWFVRTVVSSTMVDARRMPSVRMMPRRMKSNVLVRPASPTWAPKPTPTAQVRKHQPRTDRIDG